MSNRWVLSGLGSREFCEAYGVCMPYVAGAMYKGIASEALVVRMARARLLSFFGAGGLTLERIKSALEEIQRQLTDDEPYGVNVICNYLDSEAEWELVRMLIDLGVRNIEASAFTSVRPSLVAFRLSGLSRDKAGVLRNDHRILVKVSRPEVASLYMEPPPAEMIQDLLAKGQVTSEQAELSQQVTMADDICVEADSGGHTDMGVSQTLVPVILRLRENQSRKFPAAARIRIGSAGGLGTPEALAAAFMLGADFVQTGSINQCTIEAGTSDAVKDLLQSAKVTDTDYAPAGDLFELGSQIQVLSRRVLFPARARRLYALWKQLDSLDQIDAATQLEIQKDYLRRSFDEAFDESLKFYLQVRPETIEQALANPKKKMAVIFRWYFIYSMRVAIAGVAGERQNYQVQCGPALGAFNQWAEGSPLQNWRDRHVDTIAFELMEQAFRHFSARVALFQNQHK